jgi:hypothetical protein
MAALLLTRVNEARRYLKPQKHPLRADLSAPEKQDGNCRDAGTTTSWTPKDGRKPSRYFKKSTRVPTNKIGHSSGTNLREHVLRTETAVLTSLANVNARPV